MFLVALTCTGALAQQPRIDSVLPSQGPIAGGTIVTVKGAGFVNASIFLDRTAVTPLSQNDSEVRLMMPQHDNGYAVISARAAAGAAYGEYLYVPPRLEELPPGFITTVAGVGLFTRDYGPARQANIGVWALELDRAGTLYIADAGGGRIYRVRSDGTIERFAGGGIGPGTGDGGPAIDATLVFSRDVAIDGADNVYIGGDECRVRKVDPNGTITTIAGNGVCAFSGDGGLASQAQVGQPTYLAADSEDLFFIDWNAMRVRRIHLADGRISTFAGNGTAGFSGDGGPATSASFNLPFNDLGALALDPAGNVYLADDGNGRIRRIDRVSGIITTFYKPTAGTSDHVQGIRSLTTDRDGNVYYGGSGRIVKVSPSGAFVTSWGNGTYALPVDGGPAATSGLGHVLGLAIDAAGNVLYSDDAIARVRRINIATGLLESVAGIGPAMIGENGPATAATIGALNDIAFDRDGNLLAGETLRLRKLDRTGELLTIGGTGSFIGRFPPAPMNQIVIAPVGIETFPDGTFDMTDLSVVDHVDSTGTLRWIAGFSAACDYTGDGGPATAATLCQAWDSARDRLGNLLIADTNNNRIRRVDALSGRISTVVGNGGPVNGNERYGHGTDCGDGGPAFDACINTPYGIAFDSAQNLYISAGGSIRKVDRAGIISTFTTGLHVTKMVFDAADQLYASRFTNVDRYDRNGVRTILAGSGQSGFGGDGGPALLAKMSAGSQASGLAIDGEGNLFFVDQHRIRAIRYGAVLAPAGASVQATATGPTIRATVFDASGHPAPSVRVDFSAPSSGASCILSRPFAITNADGVALVSCTPNCIAGTYAVMAQPLNANSHATVTLTNGAGPCRRRAAGH